MNSNKKAPVEAGADGAGATQAAALANPNLTTPPAELQAPEDIEFSIRNSRSQGFYWISSVFIRGGWGELLGPYGIAVYNVLVCAADNGSQIAKLKQSTIARMSGCSERQIRNVLGELEACRIISRVAHYRQNGRRGCDRIQLLDTSHWIKPTEQTKTLPAPGAGRLPAPGAAQYSTPSFSLSTPAEEVAVVSRNMKNRIHANACEDTTTTTPSILDFSLKNVLADLQNLKILPDVKQDSVKSAPTLCKKWTPRQILSDQADIDEEQRQAIIQNLANWAYIVWEGLEIKETPALIWIKIVELSPPPHKTLLMQLIETWERRPENDPDKKEICLEADLFIKTVKAARTDGRLQDWLKSGWQPAQIADILADEVDSLLFSVGQLEKAS